jgi:hypothetical protein
MGLSYILSECVIAPGAMGVVGRNIAGFMTELVFNGREKASGTDR